jgi:hypothetical protein
MEVACGGFLHSALYSPIFAPLFPVEEISCMWYWPLRCILEEYRSDEEYVIRTA